MNSEISDDSRLTVFIDNLDRLGGDPDQWPMAEAEAARRLLADSTAAQQALADARKVDLSLKHLPRYSAPSGVLNRIAEQPTPDTWETLSAWFTGALWRPLLAGSVPLIAGFVLGFTLAPNTSDTMADQMSLLTLSTNVGTAGNEEFDYGL